MQSHFVEGKPVTRLMHRDPEQMHLEILKATERTLREEVAREEAGVLPDWLRRLADDFRASRAFLTAVELDLFSAVGEGATSAEVAEQVGADPRATETLLNALTSLGLLVKQGDDASRTAPTPAATSGAACPTTRAPRSCTGSTCGTAGRR